MCAPALRRQELLMAFYRLYFIDLHGRVENAVELECACDADAGAFARAELSCHPDIEVWEGTRIVHRLKASSGG